MTSPLEQARRELSALSGLTVVLDHPHEVLDLLLTSPDIPTAVSRLKHAFAVDDIQAGVIVETQFRRVTINERARLSSQIQELQAEIARLGGSEV